MPSLDAPTHYERTSGTEPEEKDDFFKWFDASTFVETTGYAASPIGWVGLLLVEEQHRFSFLSDNTWANVDNVADAGWYVVRCDDNGLIWAMAYGEDATFNEERARADFAEAVAAYDQWVDEVEDDEAANTSPTWGPWGPDGVPQSD